MRLNIEPTKVCNLRCPSCVRSTPSFKTQNGTQLEISTLLNALGTKYFNVIEFVGSGETLLHKHLNESLYHMKKAGFYVHIDTNAQLLKQKASVLARNQIDYVSTSIDGLTQETYGKYRIGGQLSKALEGVKELQEQKKFLGTIYPRIGMQFIRFKHNRHVTEEDLLKFAAEHGFDQLHIKSAIGDMADLEYVRTDGVRRFRTFHLTPLAKHQKPKKPVKNIMEFHGLERPPFMDFSITDLCFRPVINCQGEVYPCCRLEVDKFGGFVVGTITEQTIDDVLESDNYRNFLITMMSPWGNSHCLKSICATEINGEMPKYKLDELLLQAAEPGKPLTAKKLAI